MSHKVMKVQTAFFKTAPETINLCGQWLCCSWSQYSRRWFESSHRAILFTIHLKEENNEKEAIMAHF